MKNKLVETYICHPVSYGHPAHYTIKIRKNRGRVTHVLMIDPKTNKGKSLTNGVESAIEFAMLKGAKDCRFFQYDEDGNEFTEVVFDVRFGVVQNPRWLSVGHEAKEIKALFDI